MNVQFWSNATRPKWKASELLYGYCKLYNVAKSRRIFSHISSSFFSACLHNNDKVLASTNE